MTKIVRLSHTMKSGDARYPGNPDVKIQPCHAFHNGDSCNTFEITFFNHNGTHIDFPKHYINEGRSLCDYQMNEMIFDEVLLLPVSAGRGMALRPEHIENWRSSLSSAQALLLKTGYQSERATDQFPNGPYITIELAKWLRSNFPNLRCIGLDTLSITSMVSPDEGQDVHRILLGGKDAPFVIEDMDLSLLSSQPQKLYVAPWYIEGVDGGPCTAFAEVAN